MYNIGNFRFNRCLVTYYYYEDEGLCPALRKIYRELYIILILSDDGIKRVELLFPSYHSENYYTS